MTSRDTPKMGLLKKSLRAPLYFASNIYNEGYEGLKKATYTSYSHARMGLSGNIGNNVFIEDWDILLILDACRVDLMETIVEDFDFLPSSIPTWTSIGSKSPAWLERTFTPEHQREISDCTYITGNPFTAKVELQSSPNTMHEVWKEHWDDDLKTIPARRLTDTAIRTWRNGGHKRMIVHYMQPHAPFIDHSDLGEYGNPDDFGEGFDDLWGRVGDDIGVAELWEAYKDNLRYVLEDVELLLNNIDADTVIISSDHGNAIGEWGIYGHPRNILLPCLREVPWIETCAKDSGEYTPKLEPKEPVNNNSVDDRLRALGYK